MKGDNLLKVDFKKYYNDYLGIDEKQFKSGKRVFSSVQRNVPLNFQYVYKMIATVLEDSVVFSIAPEFYNSFTKFINGKNIESLKQVIEVSHDFFQSKLNDFKVRQVYRLTLKEENTTNLYNGQAIQLKKSILFESNKNMNEKEKIMIWNKRRKEIEEGRKYVVLIENNIVSSAKISDIDFLGGNIAVFTDPKYRNQGYGKQVVKGCINWCLDKDILPIYLVDIENIPSVKLAESLGFEIKSTEVIVSLTLYN